jgi:hypothetical protein
VGWQCQLHSAIARLRSNGITPQMWKRSLVVPIPKERGNPDLTKLRHIQLLDTTESSGGSPRHPPTTASKPHPIKCLLAVPGTVAAKGRQLHAVLLDFAHVFGSMAKHIGFELSLQFPKRFQKHRILIANIRIPTVHVTRLEVGRRVHHAA